MRLKVLSPSLLDHIAILMLHVALYSCRKFTPFFSRIWNYQKLIYHLTLLLSLQLYPIANSWLLAKPMHSCEKTVVLLMTHIPNHRHL